MKFEITRMWIEHMDFSPSEDKTDNNQQYKMKINCSMDYNSVDNQTVRFIMNLDLHSSEKYKLSASQFVTLKFSDKLTSDQAEDELRTANAPVLFYPSIRAFIVSFLASAGHNGKATLPPMVNFSEE